MKRILPVILLLLITAITWAKPEDNLIQAIKNKSLTQVKSILVENDYDVNSFDKKGWTPLHWVSYYGGYDIANYLIESGANVDAKSKYYFAISTKYEYPIHSTPLLIAAEQGHSDIVRLLIRKNANIWAKDARGLTLMHSAAGGNLHWLISYLIKIGANINVQDNNGYTPLQAAADFNKLNSIKYLIKMGAVIDANNQRSYSLLHSACSGGSLWFVKYLLKKGFNINGIDNNTASPLDFAVQHNHIHIVNYLLSRGAKIDPTRFQWSPLHTAVITNNLKLVKQFVQKGLDINLKSTSYYRVLGKNFQPGETPLSLAVQNGNYEITKYLIEKGGKIDFKYLFNNNLIHISAKSGNFDLLKLLLKKGVPLKDTNNQGFNALHFSAESGSIKIAQYLLKNDFDVNSLTQNGESPLILAVKHNKPEMVQFLLSHGANPNIVDRYKTSPIKVAVQYNLTKIINILMQYKVETKTTYYGNRNLLHDAANSGNLDLVKKLLSMGFDINSKTTYNKTPLHDAVYSGNYQLVQYLVNNGANIHTEGDYAKWQPIHIAAFYGYTKIVKLFLDKGVKVDVVDGYGYTPLIRAVKSTSTKTVELLLSHGADINKTITSNNRSALIEALVNKSKSIALYLINKGANINHQDNYGYTALYFATYNGFSSISRLLYQKGANILVETKRGENLLHAATQAGTKWIVIEAIKKGIDVNKKPFYGRSPIENALYFSNLNIAKILIENGVDINSAIPYSKKNILHIAAEKENLRIAQFAVSKGIDINSTNSYDQSALHAISQKKFSSPQGVAIAKLLINSGININSQDYYKNTPLHHAVQNSNLPVIKLLIKYKADTNIKNKADRSPISLTKNSYIIAILKKAGAKPNPVIELFDAIHDGNSKLVIKLLNQGLNVNTTAQNNMKLTYYKMYNNIQPLHFAVYNGQKNIVKFLLQKKADVNARITDDWTPLHIASQKGYLEIAKELIDHGAKINSKLSGTYYTKDQTPLHLAAKQGNIDLVQLLISKNAQIDVVDGNGKSSLFYSVESNHRDIAEYLIDNGANINIIDRYKTNLLQLAIQKRNKDLAIFLINKGVNIHVQNYSGDTPLHTASATGELDLVKVLLEKGANLNKTNKYGMIPLHSSINYNSNVVLVKFLLDKGSNVNAKTSYGTTALHIAVYNNQAKVVQLLINAKADLNVSDKYKNTPVDYAKTKEIQQLLVNAGAKLNLNKELFKAINSNDLKQVQELIKKGAKADATTDLHSFFGSTTNWSTLHASASIKSFAITQFLISKGADVNKRNSAGFTPIYFAIGTDNKQIVKLLIKHGAKVDVQSDYGVSPLHVSAYNGNVEMAKFLLKNGARLDVKMNNDWYPIHYAWLRNKPNMVIFFINQGVSHEVKLYGNTLLHWAAQNGYTDLIQLLLKKGINVNATNLQGATPIDLAKNLLIKELLLKSGAKININYELYKLISTNNFKKISEYLNNGADPNYKPSKNHEPMLITAIKRKSFKTANLLIDKGANVNEIYGYSKLTPLFTAIQNNAVSVVKKLIEKNVNLNQTTNLYITPYMKKYLFKNVSPLHLAVYSKNYKITQLLLKNNANLNQQDEEGRTPLDIATDKNIIKLLKESGAKFNINFELRKAALENNIGNVKDLLSQDADPNNKGSQGDIALIHAVENKNGEMIKLLIQKKSDTNAVLKNYTFKSPSKTWYDQEVSILHIAIKVGDIKVVTFLLANGAVVNQSTKRGYTPLHVAVIYENIPVIKLLINKGASINAKDEQDNTPLNLTQNEEIKQLLIKSGGKENPVIRFFQALDEGNTDLMKKLIADGVDINVTNKKGFAPLHIAIQKGDLNLVKIFLGVGADPNIPVSNKWWYQMTPVHMATHYNHPEILKLLIDKGGKVNLKLSNGSTAIDLAKSDEIKEILKKAGAKSSLELANIDPKLMGSYKALKITPMNQTIGNIVISNLDGKNIPIKNYKGKIIFLNFWATWCPPCVQEMPSMEKLHKAMKNDNFVMLAVSLGEKKSVVENFLKSKNFTFPIFLDQRNSLGSMFGVSAIPTTLIINKEGVIIGKTVGARNWGDKKSIEFFKQLAK